MFVTSPMASGISPLTSSRGTPSIDAAISCAVSGAVERDEPRHGSAEADEADHVGARPQRVAVDRRAGPQLPEDHGLEDLFGGSDELLHQLGLGRHGKL